MFGTRSCTLTATDAVQLIAGSNPEDRYDACLFEQRLLANPSSGLMAAEARGAEVKKAA